MESRGKEADECIRDRAIRNRWFFRCTRRSCSFTISLQRIERPLIDCGRCVASVSRDNARQVLAQHLKRSDLAPQFRAHLKNVREHFGALRAVEVTAEAVDKCNSARQMVGSTPATINCSTLLSRVFKLAIKRRHLSFAPEISHLSNKVNARQGLFCRCRLPRIDFLTI